MPRSELLTSPPRVPLIAPSILSADFADLASDCRAVLSQGADLLHLDVMDGHFVPNLTIGPALCGAVRRALPDAVLDAHLMIEDPRAYVRPFADAGVDNLTFHVEVEEDPAELCAVIRDAGMLAGIAINPPTSLERLLPWVEHADLILVMSVNPGFSGQAFIPEVLEKVERVRPMLRPEQRLEMDGGVNADTAGRCRAAGADLLVAGSAVFGAEQYADAILAIRGADHGATARG